MRLKIFFLVIGLFLSSSFAYSADRYDGPRTIEQAKDRFFKNRQLNSIEGIWYDEGENAYYAITRKNDSTFNKWTISHKISKYNGTLDIEGNVLKTATPNVFIYKTTVYNINNPSEEYGASATMLREGNLITYQIKRFRDSRGREWKFNETNLYKVWPAAGESVSQNDVGKRIEKKTKWLNGKKYNYKVRSDYKTTDSSKRTCHQFTSQYDRYYRCASSNGKLISYTKEYFNDQGMFRKGDIVRYRIPSDSWMLSAGYLLDKDRGLKIGGWIRRNTGVTIYGVVRTESGKFEFYQGTDGKINNESGLEEYKVEKLIEFSKISFEESKKIKNDLDALLEVKTSTNKSNKNYSSKPKTKIKTKKTDFKQYWWVVVLIAVGAFFVYMHTTKDLPKGKRIAKKTSKSPGAIKKFFNGDVDLTTSFWGVYFGAGLVLGLLSFALEKNEALAGLYALFILLPFSVYAMIGTWRSASKYKIEKKKKKEGTGWGTAAQVYIVLSIIRAIVQIGRGLS